MSKYQKIVDLRNMYLIKKSGYFDDRYYKDFVKNNPNSFLGVVLLDNKVISAAIFMYDGIYGHYHLSGSDKQYLNYSPNNFMLYRSALELKKRGVELFHLGGGTTSDQDDSLFAFKKNDPVVYPMKVIIHNSQCIIDRNQFRGRNICAQRNRLNMVFYRLCKLFRSVDCHSFRFRHGR